jgi:hypothetical protein
VPQYLRGARWALRCRWAVHPTYLAWSRYRGTRAILSDDTQIVIEAYMRSANTFSVVAFQMAQPQPVRVAHHLHAPIQLIAAAERGIPALSIIRKPADATASVTIRSPYVSLEQAVDAYIRFYEPLIAYRDRCFVARFEDVTSDLGAVIDRVNANYGTAFTPFDHTEENVRQAYALIDERALRPAWAPAIRAYVSGEISRADLAAARNGGPALDQSALPESRVARPSEQRKQRAARIRERYASPQLAPLRERAEAVYRTFADRA